MTDRATQPRANRQQPQLPDAILRRRPSKETKARYLELRVKRRDYPAATERCGKWLIFLPRANVDEAWFDVARALLAKRLGDFAKLSTAAPSRLAERATEHVICVYTYDCADVVDVRRVREELRILGFTRKLPYKTDAATYERRYRVTGHEDIATYYE